MTTQLNPYIHFNGNCREAMTFYHSCLGGELTMQKISESPMAAQLPSAMGGHILHSSIISGAITIMGSDVNSDPVKGNDITLCLNCGNDQELNEYFTRLSKGGEVKMQLHQTFWGSTYGELTDKFGMNWMFSYMKT